MILWGGGGEGRKRIFFVDLVERGVLTIVGEIGAIKMAAVIIISIINIYIIIIYWSKGVLQT